MFSSVGKIGEAGNEIMRNINRNDTQQNLQQNGGHELRIEVSLEKIIFKINFISYVIFLNYRTKIGYIHWFG
jgi:hypothetical protein